MLKDDGTLWLNLGDSYAGSWGNYHPNSPPGKHGQRPKETQRFDRRAYESQEFLPPTANYPGLKPKDLCGIPWCVAFALQADGWYLRSDIIWAKPNPMPESVTDRPTKSHEYVFLMSKSERYYYDANAIVEDALTPESVHVHVGGNGTKAEERANDQMFATRPKTTWITGSKRNKRTVWTVATSPFPEAHFATFPPDLIKPMVMAGTPPMCCGVCGATWKRVTEPDVERKSQLGKGYHDHSHDLTMGMSQEKKLPAARGGYVTLGWRPTCEHKDDTGRSIVLDPFMGAGTVALVAKELNRRYLGIELSPTYCRMAEKRLRQGVLNLLLTASRVEDGSVDTSCETIALPLNGTSGTERGDCEASVPVSKIDTSASA